MNSYAVFAELMHSISSAQGRCGVILPIGIATDHTTRFFFDGLVRESHLVSLFGLENEERIFPGVHNEAKFCLLTLSRSPMTSSQFVFFARTTSHLHDEERRFSLSAADIYGINPNTHTCPTFRYRRDADLGRRIYSALPVLVNETTGTDPFGLDGRIRRLFDMGDADTVATCLTEYPSDGSAALPMYEGKMISQYDHHFGTYDGQTQAQANKGYLPYPSPKDHDNPEFRCTPRFFIPQPVATRRVSELWKRDWLLVWRDITNSVAARSVVACIIPFGGADFTLRVGMPTASPSEAIVLLAQLNSMVFDYCARQKIGGTHLADFVLKQLPSLDAETLRAPCPFSQELRLSEWVGPRVLELTYTSWDLAGFALDLDYPGPPFRFIDDRRRIIRAELDAAFFYLFGLPRDDVEYVLDSFPIVRRNDEKAYAEYRTKRLILERFDALARGVETGHPYETTLDPRPGDPSLTHTAERTT